MTLTLQRRFVTPSPDETLEALAARALRDVDEWLKPIPLAAE